MVERWDSGGSLDAVLSDVVSERAAQDRRWGMQEWPDGTGPDHAAAADEAKADCHTAYRRGELTWRHILAEEVAEAFAETDPAALRAELIQVAAVAVKWVQALDRRDGYVPGSVRYSGEMAAKLVRDRIPGLYPDGDHRAAHDDAEYGYLLRAKLYEEVGEYLASGDVVELADILEVLHAFAARHDLTPGGLEELRAAKAHQRGSFTRRLVWQRRPSPQTRGAHHDHPVPDSLDLPPARVAALVNPIIDRLHTGVHQAAGATGPASSGSAVAVRERFGLPDLGFHLTLRLALPIRPVPVAAVAALLRYFPDSDAMLHREIDQQIQAGLITMDGDHLVATRQGRQLLDKLTACYASAVTVLWGEDPTLPKLVKLLDRLIGAAKPAPGGLFATLIPPYQPADASPGLVLFNQLGAFRCHRADAHAAAWTAAGLTAAQIKAMPPGPERDRIEDDTNARAGVPFTALTPEERLELLAALARLSG